MAEHTGIEWCDHTFNPWIGCTPISNGCDGCYAKALVENRMGKDFGVLWRTSGPNWRKPHQWNAAAIAPCMWRAKYSLTRSTNTTGQFAGE